MTVVLTTVERTTIVLNETCSNEKSQKRRLSEKLTVRNVTSHNRYLLERIQFISVIRQNGHLLEGILVQILAILVLNVNSTKCYRRIFTFS